MVEVGRVGDVVGGPSAVDVGRGVHVEVVVVVQVVEVLQVVVVPVMVVQVLQMVVDEVVVVRRIVDDFVVDELAGRARALKSDSNWIQRRKHSPLASTI